MKKIIPIIAAALVFLAAFVFLNARKGQQVEIVSAAWDLPAGHTMTSSDVVLTTVDEENVPDGAITDPALVVGQTLRVDRTGGDLITYAHLGGREVDLAPNERALAVEVTDSAGLAGLLRPGDQVGLTAVLLNNQGTYSKMIAEGLRVLYVSPEFEAADPAAYEPTPEGEEGGFTGSGTTPNRNSTGVVVLAVPTDAIVVAYDFAAFGVESESRTISVIDLLPAMDHASNVALSLFIQPSQSNSFSTSGLSMNDLAITPGPSPTPGPDDLLGLEDETALTTTPAPTPVP